MRAALHTLLAASLLLGGTAAARAQTGAVAGSVTVALARLTLADLGHAVVYLEALDGAPRGRPAERPAVSLRQRSARFQPGFLAIAVGEAIEMPNDDTIYHNVFSYSRPNDFDLGLYRAGESRTVRFEHPGPVRLYCSIHEKMNGLVFVAPSRWFAVPDTSGAFSIGDVAPGRYRLTLWSERAPQQTRVIEVTAGATRRVELRVALAPKR